ncbi:MAG: rod shape-determining protein MreD [Luteitalea sp.]|nr:rod shape-determining protein MreD [Luteitalea sp.]
MRLLGIGLAIGLALTVQTTLAYLAFGSAVTPNFVLVVVIWAGLTFGPAHGMLAGTLGGLAQDALAGGVLGVAGFSQTLVGFLAGVIGAQFIMVHALPRMTVIFLLSLLHIACFTGIYAMIGLTRFFAPWRPIVLQAGLNALVGMVIFRLLDLVPETLGSRGVDNDRLRRRFQR